MVYDIDDITFWGMNIPKEVERLMENTKPCIKESTTEKEFKAYCLGIENTISIMEQLLQSGNDGESITFYDWLAGTSATEYKSDDLIQVVNTR